MRAFAQSIVETVRHPLLVLDADLRVQDANRAFFRTFHLANDALGRRFLSPEGIDWDMPPLRESLQRVALDGQHFEELYLEYEFPGLGPKILLANARRVFRDEDHAPMVLLAIEDVTERRQAQDELHRLNLELEDRVRQRTAQLEAANRELEAFCYSVSHDLRAPLRAVDGFSQELLQTYADTLDEQGRHYLQRVRAASQRMAQLIDDLLQLSRLSRSEMHTRPVDLSDLAEQIAADLRRREPGRDVQVEIHPGVRAHGDPGLLRVALENLFDNAWKFTSRRPRARITFGQAEHHGKNACYVRDDGAGFDMRYADKLFGAFQRLHRETEFPGTGIGLATVQRIVGRHGGRVWAEGEVDKGACFYFTLPEGGSS